MQPTSLEQELAEACLLSQPSAQCVDQMDTFQACSHRHSAAHLKGDRGETVGVAHKSEEIP